MHNRPPADLFARLPGHLRTRDAAEGRPLQALMEIARSELRIVEQDIDQLYDNWFVETCEPWVLPYIAALLGATPMREIGEDQAGLLRGYVANILSNRQAKGTAATVEQVAREVSGWPAVAVEFFQRLAVSQNVNHVRPEAPAFADVRRAARARDSRSPFSTMAHAAAAGRPEGWAGRYNIPHLGLFVWRWSAAPVWPVLNVQAGYTGGAMPRPDAPDPGLLRFDPLGRDMPLVNRPAADRSVAARMTEASVPGPLTRAATVAALAAAGPGQDGLPFRVRLDGTEVPVAQLRCCNLEVAPDGTWRRPDAPGHVLIDPELGRLSLHPDDEGRPVETGFAHALPFDIGGGAYDRRGSLAAWLPEFDIPGEAPPWQACVTRIASLADDNPPEGGLVVPTLRAAVAAWNAHAAANPEARGIIAVLDNATYDEALTAGNAIQLPPGTRLAIVAAAWPLKPDEDGAMRRLPSQLSPLHRRPVVLGSIVAEGQEAGEETGGALVLDGLVVTGNLTARDDGDLGALRLYNCTIGARGEALDRGVRTGAGNARLSVLAERCIIGRVDLPSVTGAVTIARSILGEDQTAGDGAGPLTLRLPLADLSLAASTVFGRTTCRTLTAENAILTGTAQADHRQTGCVRFCYLPEASVVPRRHRCVPRAADDPKPRPIFAATRFRDPEFGMLGLRTPAAILEGAEDGMEMGVGFANRDPARRANIRDAVQEFAPFGLIPGLIYMT